MMSYKSIPAAFAVSIAFAVFLTGCAGSASHKVVSSHEAADNERSCRQLDAEIIKTQVIIDGVNNDKDDISGADVVDGLLWFPFNLIAKSENYKNALDAADKRIARLEDLREKQDCQIAIAGSQESTTPQYASLSELSGSLSQELGELNELYKSGALTDEEYKAAKLKVLDNIGN